MKYEYAIIDFRSQCHVFFGYTKSDTEICFAEIEGYDPEDLETLGFKVVKLGEVK